jgi:UDP-glucose 4-epimerase
MKNVVITGATGMIGRTLVEVLLKNDINILAIIRKDSKKRNTLPINKKIKIIECNLDELKELNINSTYDTFFHFAWDGTFGESRDNLYVQNLNVKYTLDALELAHRIGCNTFIGAGSQAEYGRVNGMIFPNTKTEPENGYGIAKLAARTNE